MPFIYKRDKKNRFAQYMILINTYSNIQIKSNKTSKRWSNP